MLQLASLELYYRSRVWALLEGLESFALHVQIAFAPSPSFSSNTSHPLGASLSMHQYLYRALRRCIGQELDWGSQTYFHWFVSCPLISHGIFATVHSSPQLQKLIHLWIRLSDWPCRQNLLASSGGNFAPSLITGHLDCRTASNLGLDWVSIRFVPCRAFVCRSPPLKLYL